MGGLPRRKSRPRADDAAHDDLLESLSRTDAGRIIVHHDGGSFEISTNGTPWCKLVSEEMLRAFADKLALVAEDPRMLLGITGEGDFVELSAERKQLRRWYARRRR